MRLARKNPKISDKNLILFNFLQHHLGLTQEFLREKSTPKLLATDVSIKAKRKAIPLQTWTGP
jgi:hypothetical protein